MNEIQQVFYELFFGAGGWLGTLLLVSIILTLGYANKYARIVFMPLSAFIGLWYLDNVSSTSNLVWNAIVFFIMPILLMFMFKDKRG